MPESDIYVRPAALGLDILMVGSDVNFRVDAQLTDRIEDDETDVTEAKQENEQAADDDMLPKLEPI